MAAWSLPEATDFARQVNQDPGAASYASQLYSLLQEHRWTSALEIGSAWGISTLAILLANPAGHLTSVDINPHVQAVTEVEANNLEARWTFVVASSRDFWATNRDHFDLIYIDGDHSAEGARIDIFNAWRFLHPGGLLVMDDITHPAHLDEKDSREGYLYGVSFAAWQLITEEGHAEVGGTPRLGWMKKPAE